MCESVCEYFKPFLCKSTVEKRLFSPGTDLNLQFHAAPGAVIDGDERAPAIPDWNSKFSFRLDANQGCVWTINIGMPCGRRERCREKSLFFQRF